MEDEDETESHASGGTGSQGSPAPSPPPPPPRPNGRITVTVATVPPSSQPNALTLALPIQQNHHHQQPVSQPPSQTKAAGNGGGREECWSEGATGVLIDAWGERYLELSRGNLKQKHWKDVADIVSSREDYSKTPKTDIQCKNRIDTVKKKYKLEKAKIAAAGGPSKWPFFERLDQLMGTSAKLNSSAAAAVGPSPSGSTPCSSRQRVPMGIPMGVRSAPQFRPQQQGKFPLPQLNPKQLFRKRQPPPPVEDSDDGESEQEPSPDSADDFPAGTYERKRPRNQRGMGIRHGLVNNNKSNNNSRGKDGGAERAECEVGNPLKELTRAILKFGEAYEQAETLKLQQLVDMEKQRMKLGKEMELQTMQFFMKTQLELSQLKSSSTKRVGNTHNNNNDHHHHHRHNNSSNHNSAAKNNSNNNSDSSN